MTPERVELSSRPLIAQLCDLSIRYGAEIDDWIEFYKDGNEGQGHTISFTPMHSLASHAVIRSKHFLKDGIEYLVDEGFDVNAREEGGRTPLLQQMGHGVPEIERTEAFLEAGADANAIDKTGCNALHLVVDALDCLTSYSPENKDKHFKHLAPVFEALLQNGCDPNHRNDCRVTVSMRMRHAVANKVWEIWLSVLAKLDLLDSVDLTDLDKNVRAYLSSRRPGPMLTFQTPCPCKGLCTACSRSDVQTFCSRRARFTIHQVHCHFCQWPLMKHDMEDKMAKSPAFWDDTDDATSSTSASTRALGQTSERLDDLCAAC